MDGQKDRLKDRQKESGDESVNKTVITPGGSKAGYLRLRFLAAGI